MTLLVDQDGAAVTNSTSIEDAPAVRITGDDVVFTNADGGSLKSTHPNSAAIVIEGEGVEVINLAGGLIQGATLQDIAIQGSAFADEVGNAGTIWGSTELGSGDDTFTMSGDGYGLGVDLGDGDDLYVHSASGALGTLEGGTGTDTLELTNADSVLSGAFATGFERLVVANDPNRTYNLVDFSGYQSVQLEAGGFYNFIGSVNPDVDIELGAATDFIVGPGSSFASVTGSAGADGVEVNSGTVAGDVDLGAGADVFWFQWGDSYDSPVVGGTVDAGTGDDILILVAHQGRTFDLADFTGFETLDAGTWSGDASNLRIVNASGFTKVQADAGPGARTVLAESDLPDAVLFVSFGAAAVLEATATVKQVGAAFDFAANPLEGDPAWGVTVENGGTVLGDVHLSLSDDTYDATSGGTAGGNVYGYAGDDVLKGSGLADRFYGGYGADQLTGNDGDDLLDGGAAADTLAGGLGNDVYVVDDASDVVTELAGEGTDTVRTALGSGAAIYALAANVENLVGTSGSGQTVAGNGLDNGFAMGGGNDVIDLSAGGDDSASGGGGNDYFFFGGAFTAADSVQGGAGTDTVALLGSYDLTLGAGTLVGVETLSLLSGTAGGGTTHVTYSIVTDDANVPAGGQLTVYASGLLADETLLFNGTAETNGVLTVYGGAGNDIFAGGPANDTFVGGGGNDLLVGLGGNDWLEGDAGADTLRGGFGSDLFVYKSASDSPTGGMDHILDFEDTTDLISLQAIDANVNVGGDQAFTFIGADAFHGTAGELRVYQSGSDFIVEGDTNGDGSADFAIQVTTVTGYGLDAPDFML